MSFYVQGPTSYGPVIDAAVDIVERTGGQYHVLVIIADGQVLKCFLSHPFSLLYSNKTHQHAQIHAHICGDQVDDPPLEENYTVYT